MIGEDFSAQAAEILARCYFLGDFLAYCVVSDDYRPPISLTSGLALSARGTRLAGQVKGNGIELREAQLAAFMEPWAGHELLVDLENIELDKLRANVSSEIRRKKIRFPFGYGRELYDLVAASAFHGASTPTNAEAIGLLEQLPQGVFQVGPYVSGPYGLIEASQWRTIPPTQSIPAYHCDKIYCDRVHHLHFTTGDTKVAAATKSLREKTSRYHSVNTEAVAAVEVLISKQVSPYSWQSSSTLLQFLGDCLTIEELRALAVVLLNGNEGKLREEVANQTSQEVRAADEFVESAGRAELLQILLLDSNDHIHKALNLLVWDKVIAIPPGELRYPMLASSGRGALSIRLEASSLGVRHAPSRNFMFLRLQSVIDQAFPGGDEAAKSRLMWQLRSYDGETASAKLNSALAEGEPSALVARLLVADPAVCARAFQELGLSLQRFSLASDSEITQLLTWHLGFEPTENVESLAMVSAEVATLQGTIATIPADAPFDKLIEDRVRAISGPLFPRLERLLKRSLAFSVWALLRDHYKIDYELRYSTGDAAANLDRWLSERPSLPALSDGTTIAEILACFGFLAKELRKLEMSECDYRRPVGEWPRIARDESSSFEFPFEHTIPFLDLGGTARSTLIAVIREVAQRLSLAKVAEVRNGLLHDKEQLPSKNQIEEACVAIQSVISSLTVNGVSPTMFAVHQTDGDSYGRRRLILRSNDNNLSVMLSRPSVYHLGGFPETTQPQLIMLVARLRNSTEPLRFKVEYESSFRSMWLDYPKRAPESPKTAVASVEAV